MVVIPACFEVTLKELKGVYSDGDPPLPIPNREVKPVSADGTAPGWESRSMPDLEGESIKTRPFLFSFIFNSSFSIFNCFTYLSVLNQFMWKWHYSVYLIKRKKKALIKV